VWDLLVIAAVPHHKDQNHSQVKTYTAHLTHKKKEMDRHFLCTNKNAPATFLANGTEV
jgi:hypothetical protein